MKWNLIRSACTFMMFIGLASCISSSYFLAENLSYRDWQQSPISLSSTKWVPYQISYFDYSIHTKVPELVYSYTLHGKEYGHSNLSLRNLFYKLFSLLPLIQQTKAFIDPKDPSHSIVVILSEFDLISIFILGIVLFSLAIFLYKKAVRMNKMTIIQHRFRGILKREQSYGVHRRGS